MSDALLEEKNTMRKDTQVYTMRSEAEIGVMCLQSWDAKNS